MEMTYDLQHISKQFNSILYFVVEIAYT